MKFNKYDAPILAMIKTFNRHLGEEKGTLRTMCDRWFEPPILPSGRISGTLLFLYF